MISMLLAVLLASPNYDAGSRLSHSQVRARAYQIVQMLKRQDPRVLRSVLYYMDWVPRFEYKKQTCVDDAIQKLMQE